MDAQLQCLAMIDNSLFTSLSLAPAWHLKRESLERYVCRFHNLTSLNLFAAKQLNDDWLLLLGDALPELTDLDVSNGPSYGQRSNGHNLTDAGVEIIAKSFPKIRKLNLANCWDVSDNGLKHFLPTRTSIIKDDLASLNISYTAVGDEGLEVLSKCASLSSFIFFGASRVSDGGIKHLASSSSKLTALHISGSDSITDESFRFLSLIPELAELKMIHCKKIRLHFGIEGDHDPLPKFPKVTILNLGVNEQLTDASVDAIISCFPNVKNLNLERCESISDAGIRSLLFFDESSERNNGMENLRELSLRDCRSLTNEALITSAAATFRPRLAILDICNCYSMTYDIVKNIEDMRPSLYLLHTLSEFGDEYY